MMEKREYCYKVENGNKLYESLWWNNFWDFKCVKELEELGYVSKYGLDVKDGLAFVCDDLVIKCGTKQYDELENKGMLCKNPVSKRMQNFYKFKSTNNEVKKMNKDIKPIIRKYYEKTNPILFHHLLRSYSHLDKAFNLGVNINDNGYVIFKSNVKINELFSEDVTEISLSKYYSLLSEIMKEEEEEE